MLGMKSKTTTSPWICLFFGHTNLADFYQFLCPLTGTKPVLICPFSPENARRDNWLIGNESVTSCKFVEFHVGEHSRLCKGIVYVESTHEVGEIESADKLIVRISHSRRREKYPGEVK